ncbi:hypothetical protein [Paraburkholderia sp. WC7.3b]|uniref:Uncharacterized protein n=1 Tax=Paraburkholderia podalyriae TaxID=1938811 RepID=A0ABR7PZA7_9BURK|nr:hypothetical protein [Paraburkholderia podalyriae]
MTAASLSVSSSNEYVSYGRLCRSPLNVRKKAPTGIEGLAETNAENGLMQINLRRLRFFWTQIWGKTCDPNWSG